MRFVPLLLLLGCASSHTGTVPTDPPAALRTAEPAAPAVTPAPAAPAAAMLDEATLKAKSHAWFDAYDRADLSAVKEPLGPAFVEYDLARFYSSKLVFEWIQSRIDRHAPVRSRTWHQERVFLAPNTAIFIGESVEHVPADGDKPAAEQDLWNQLVWVHDGTAWRLQQWAIREGGPDAEREGWNTTLRKQAIFKTTVNSFLERWAKGKKPGTALDIATGQGRNAVWLATQGWKVTGVDISDVGLEMTAKAALAKKTKVTTVEADIDTYDLGKDKWDLVTLIYAGSRHEMI